MSAYYHSYQSTASSILGSFSFKESFPVYLKKFFKQHKKYGSRDRKIIADLCFGFFRIGNAATSYSIVEQMMMGYFSPMTLMEDTWHLPIPPWRIRL
jgi:16S rRNA (cytosine967-C5)-methyltransferase